MNYLAVSLVADYLTGGLHNKAAIGFFGLSWTGAGGSSGFALPGEGSYGLMNQSSIGAVFLA